MVVRLFLTDELTTPFPTPLETVPHPTTSQLQAAVIRGDLRWFHRRWSLLDSEQREAVLVWACLFNQPDLVTASLEQGASDLNAGLVAATQGGQRALVEQLLNRGATAVGSAFSFACEHCDVSLVELLWSWAKKLNRQRGIDINDDEEFPSLTLGMDAAASRNHVAIVRFLLEQGAEPKEGLWCAARADAYETVQLLLNSGTSWAPDDVYGDVLTDILKGALEKGNLRVSRLLLQRGARLPSMVELQDHSFCDPQAIYPLLTGRLPAWQ